MTNEQRILLDPTAETASTSKEKLPRLGSIEGKTVGLLDISKARGDVFLDCIEAELTKLGATVKRYSKPTFTRVAPVDLKQQIATECQAVIEALAD